MLVLQGCDDAAPRPFSVDDVGDSDLFTGRELKRILRELLAGSVPGSRWIEMEDAAHTMRVKHDTLRRRCARWAMMQDPPVRVRKKSGAAGSHWLLWEQDVLGFAQARAEHDALPSTEIACDSLTDAVLIGMVTRDL
jgi:3-mercaptopyruvate sulfurtransferase SseA